MRVTPRTPSRDRTALRIAITTASVVTLYALSGVYVVGADECGVVTRFGRIVADDVAPGVRYHAPWPFERARSPRLRVVETALAEGATGRGRSQGNHRLEFLTGDRSLVEAGVAIEYEVAAPAAVVVLAANPSLVVRRAAESGLADAVGRATLDDVLSQRVASVEIEATSRAQATLDAVRSGIRITSLKLEAPRLAGPAAAAYARMGGAVTRRHAAVREAEGYRTRITALARGEAAALLASVNEHRSRVVSTAEGEAARFTALLAEYRDDPAAVRDRLYRETMQEVFRRVRTRVVDTSAVGGALQSGVPSGEHR